MPLYEFQCRKCEAITEVSRKISERNDPLLCEEDGEVMERVVSLISIRHGGGIHGTDAGTPDWGNLK